jgi:hypothetical protein
MLTVNAACALLSPSLIQFRRVHAADTIAAERRSSRAPQIMKILCPVDQADCFRRGIDYNSSTIRLDVNPATLPFELRDYIGNHLVEGHIIPREEKFLLSSPTIEGFFEAVLFAIEYDKAVKSGECATHGLFAPAVPGLLIGDPLTSGTLSFKEWLEKMDISKYAPLQEKINQRVGELVKSQPPKPTNPTVQAEIRQPKRFMSGWK